MKKPVTLREWQEMNKGIFSKKNDGQYTPQDLENHIQEEGAKIDEGLRKENDHEKTGALAFFFFWILSFCNKTNIDLERAVWDKYPAICPYCGAKKNCMCITNETKPTTWFKNPSGVIPSTLLEWQKMFYKIYGRINKTAWSVQIWLHVHEELGEASREYRLGEMAKCKEEIADVFAWLMAYCNKLEVDLAELTWQTYPGVCSHCKKEKCECPKV